MMDFCPFPHPQGKCRKCANSLYYELLLEFYKTVKKNDIIIKFVNIIKPEAVHPDAISKYGFIIIPNSDTVDFFYQKERLAKAGLEFEIKHKGNFMFNARHVKLIPTNSGGLGHILFVYELIFDANYPIHYAYDKDGLVLRFAKPILIRNYFWSVKMYIESKYTLDFKEFISFDQIKKEPRTCIYSPISLFALASVIIKKHNVDIDCLPGRLKSALSFSIMNLLILKMDLCDFPHPPGPCKKCKDNDYQAECWAEVKPRKPEGNIILSLVDRFNAEDWRPDAIEIPVNYEYPRTILRLNDANFIDFFQEFYRMRRTNLEFQIDFDNSSENWTIYNSKKALHPSIDSDFYKVQIKNICKFIKKYGSPQFYEFAHGSVLLYYDKLITFKMWPFFGCIAGVVHNPNIHLDSEKRPFLNINNIKYEIETIVKNQIPFREVEFPEVPPLFKLVSYFVKDNKIDASCMAKRIRDELD